MFLHNLPAKIRLILLLSILSISQATNSQKLITQNKSDSIYRWLSEVVKEDKATGMIAAIISGDSILSINSAGVRKFGSNKLFTNNDFIHLGSCSKAMTAVMIATLVEEGMFNWELKLIDAIPKLQYEIHKDYHNITLWQILTHQAGIPRNASDWDIKNPIEIKAKRLAILINSLKQKSNNRVNEFLYSNLGYMIAACMVEHKMGLSWEHLIKRRVFDPLEMHTANFGPPNTYDQIDQPWGHSKYGNKWKPDQSDNPPSLSPAGRIHCSINDWAKFLRLFLNDKNPILKQEQIQKLIKPNGYYAGGWGVADQEWSKGIMLSHSGSNGVWYSTVIVAPNLDRAYIVATNSRDFGITGSMCNDMIKKLIKLELK